MKFELFRDVIATFYEAERGKKLYSWSYFTWSRWIFALRRWLYTGLAHILCRIYFQMWKSLFSVLLITIKARSGRSIHTKKVKKVHKQRNTTLVACNSVVIPNESAVILATVDFKAMTSCLEMLSSFSMDSFSCWRFFLALFSTSISNSCFSWSDRISSSALLTFSWRSRIFAAACETSEYRIFSYQSKFWPFLGY